MKMNSPRFRLGSLACLILSFALLTVEVVRAQTLSGWCTFWHSQYDVSCSVGSLPTLQTTGSYDFSEMDENDALSLANDLCFALWDAALSHVRVVFLSGSAGRLLLE